MCARTAFLKELGRVNVSVLVVRERECDGGA
jgi:hypothetical protein